MAEAGTALVGHVGRKRMRFALTDAAGQVRRDSVRSFTADTTVSISGAIMDFLRDARPEQSPEDGLEALDQIVELQHFGIQVLTA